MEVHVRVAALHEFGGDCALSVFKVDIFVAIGEVDLRSWTFGRVFDGLLFRILTLREQLVLIESHLKLPKSNGGIKTVLIHSSFGLRTSK